MASREEIERLRQLARQRHRAATAKVSRLKKKNDVELTGTKYDPRRNAADISKMRTRDLQAYVKKLNEFTSRDVSYVHGAGKKTLLSGKLWNEYKRLERKLNEKNAKPYETVKDIRLPSLGDTTVEGFMGQKPIHPTTQNPSSRAPHIPINKSTKGIPNDKQLKKLIKDTQAKLAADYGDKVIARDQKVMSKFFKDMGKVSKDKALKDLRKDFWTLSPAQFAFLWNYTNFSETASMDYEIAKDHLNDKKVLAEKGESFQTQIRHMQNLVNDVKRIQF
jgi:hypothetical protein